MYGRRTDDPFRELDTKVDTFKKVEDADECHVYSELARTYHPERVGSSLLAQRQA